MKSVQIRSFFWPVFSKNAGKYGPEKNSVFGHFSRSDSKTTSVTSCPSVLGYDTISNYWVRSHLQVFDTLEPATGAVRKGVFRDFKKFTEKHLCQSLFLIKLQASVFSCEFCEIPKNTFSKEHLWTTAFHTH